MRLMHRPGGLDLLVESFAALDDPSLYFAPDEGVKLTERQLILPPYAAALIVLS